jgi:cell wall-associated NlpC family hydrolase
MQNDKSLHRQPTWQAFCIILDFWEVDIAHILMRTPRQDCSGNQGTGSDTPQLPVKFRTSTAHVNIVLSTPAEYPRHSFSNRNNLEPREGRSHLFSLQSSIIVFAVLIITASCAQHKMEHYPSSPQYYSSADVERKPASPEIREQIYQEYLQWKGTKYRLGGSAREGVDCSGFVKVVYQNIFDMNLPRTTKEMERIGKPVKKQALRTGDLVFFKPPSYPRHVGIYLGDEEFVHATKKDGVIISKIDLQYWGKYYWTARRVLPE